MFWANFERDLVEGKSSEKNHYSVVCVCVCGCVCDCVCVLGVRDMYIQRIRHAPNHTQCAATDRARFWDKISIWRKGSLKDCFPYETPDPRNRKTASTPDPRASGREV